MESWQLSPCYFETMHHPTPAWNCCLPIWTLVIYYLPSLSMCVLCLSPRDVSTSHSMSWSWVARSLRRSFPVEFPSVFIVLDEDLEDKDVKSNVMQYIGIFKKGSWIEKTMIVLWPLCLLTPLLESHDEILVLVGVSCHIPSSSKLWAS